MLLGKIDRNTDDYRRLADVVNSRFKAGVDEDNDELLQADLRVWLYRVKDKCEKLEYLLSMSDEGVETIIWNDCLGSAGDDVDSRKYPSLYRLLTEYRECCDAIPETDNRTPAFETVRLLISPARSDDEYDLEDDINALEDKELREGFLSALYN